MPVNLNIPSELTDGQELGSLTVWISYDHTLLSINYTQTAWGSIISAASVAGAQFNVPTPGDTRIGITSTFGMGGVFQPLNTGLDGMIITIGFDVNSSANIGDSGNLYI